MDTTILESNITDKPTLTAGLALVDSSIPSFFNFKYQTTTYPFTSVPFQTGYEVDPDEILAQGDGTEDTEFLIFDASKVNPSPLNPTCTVERGHTDAVCQMCEHWYQGNVNTFASFFLHEICHRMSFALGVEDITHLLTDGKLQAQYQVLYSQFNTKQPIDYYIYLINSLMPAWNTYKASENKMRTLKIGTEGSDVLALQQNLIILGYNIVADGKFGPKTQQAIEQLQKKAGLTVDGKVGPFTNAEIISEFNINSIMPKIELWCNAIKQMEGAKPGLNNPGNLRFVGQQYAINSGGFCKFDTYEHGYEALKLMLVNACGGKSKIYHPTDTLIQFYQKYAPSSDGNDPLNYANFVAKWIGVEPTVQISSLLS